MTTHISGTHDRANADIFDMPVIQNMEYRRIRYYLALTVVDICTVAASFFVVNKLYIGDWLASHGVTMMSVIIPTFLGFAGINGAYSNPTLGDPRVGAFKAVRALVFAAAVTLIVAYSFKVGENFSRVIFWSGTFCSITLLIVERLFVGRMILRRLNDQVFSQIVLVDNISWEAAPQAKVINTNSIGFDPLTDDPMEYDRLAKLIGKADRVLVACNDDRVPSWSHVLKCMAVDGQIIAPEVDQIGVLGISEHRGLRTLVVSTGPLHLRARIIKRAFDIVVSLLALTLLGPVLLAVAIAIKLESPGPVMFRQQRIGRDNVLFMMFKFRSMHTDKCDPSASVLTARNDSRVTRVGQFIRRNSIDELPQLLNVLRGEMSIVGPRPHALSAKAAERLYWEIDDRYRHRHVVKPGVTGLAQIRGFRGATILASDLSNRLASDLEYLRNWSMNRDIWIIFRTIFVIRHDNAF